MDLNVESAEVADFGKKHSGNSADELVAEDASWAMIMGSSPPPCVMERVRKRLMGKGLRALLCARDVCYVWEKWEVVGRNFEERCVYPRYFAKE